MAELMLLVSGVAFAVQPERMDDPEAVFQRIKARAEKHFAQLPNYTCHETINRVQRTRSTFRHLDTLELEVAFVGHQELFSRPGEDKFGELEKIVSTGTFGNSALGSYIDSVLSRDAAEFQYAGAGKKDGHKTLRFDLRVPVEKSAFQVRHNGAEGIAGYEGSVWVDAETLDLVRVDLKINRIPSHVRVRLIEETLHYKNLAIGNSEFNLPDHSELAATDDMGNYSLNMIKLHRCREFGADSIVKYGPPSQGGADRERQDH